MKLNLFKPKEKKEELYTLTDEFVNEVDSLKDLDDDDVEGRRKIITQLCDITELELNRAKLQKDKAEAKLEGFKTVMEGIGKVVNPVALVTTVVCVTAVAKSTVIPREGVSLLAEMFKGLIKK